MKKLTAFTAMGFMAGLLCFGVGQRVAEEVWTPKAAMAAADPSGFSQEICNATAGVVSNWELLRKALPFSHYGDHPECLVQLKAVMKKGC